MKKPNFLIIGAQKAGTTTLYEILRQHPEIYFHKLKEDHFFDRDFFYKKGVSWYLNTFYNDVKNEKIIGGVTPDYIFHSYVADRINSTLGKDIKILCILRNPVDRAYSHYLMNKARTIESESFLRACQIENERIKKNWNNLDRFSYISRGHYFEQLKRYYRIFPRENILIVNFEKELRDNPLSLYQKISIFLGIYNYKYEINERKNVAYSPKSILISKILYRNNPIAKSFNKLIPSWIIKGKLKNWLININRGSVENVYLSQNIKRKLMSQYFIKDIKLLERLTNMKFENWYEN